MNDDVKPDRLSAVIAILATLIFCGSTIYLGYSRAEERREAMRQKIQVPIQLSSETNVHFLVPKYVNDIQLTDCYQVPQSKDKEATAHYNNWVCVVKTAHK